MVTDFNKVQSYVNNPLVIRGHQNVGVIRANHYVKNLDALNRYNSLDRTYGPRPRVEDDNNAHELLGVPRISEVAVC